MCSGRHLVSSCLSTAIALIPFMSSCKEDPPPAYVRLSGDSPVVADLPDTLAHLHVFWAAWCVPCREEAPSLRELAADPPPELSVVVHAGDRNADEAAPFLGRPPDPGLHYRVDEEVRTGQAFGIATLPAAVLVVDGRLVARFGGRRDWDAKAMRSLLERLIQEHPAAH